MSLGLKLTCPLFFQNLNLISHSKTKSFRQFDLSLRSVRFRSLFLCLNCFTVHFAFLCDFFLFLIWTWLLSTFHVTIHCWCLELLDECVPSIFRSSGWLNNNTVTLSVYDFVRCTVKCCYELVCFVLPHMHLISNFYVRCLSTPSVVCVYFGFFFFALRPCPEFPWVLQCLVTFLYVPLKEKFCPLWSAVWICRQSHTCVALFSSPGLQLGQSVLVSSVMHFVFPLPHLLAPTLGLF